MITRAFLIACFAVVVAANVGHTQATPADVKHQNDCRLAAQVLETGHPAPHTEWALSTMPHCGPTAVARVAAVAVRRLRTESDTAVLGRYWAPFQHLRDLGMFEVAMEISGDARSSSAARVFAFGAIIRSVLGQGIHYHTMVGGFYHQDGLRGVGGGCSLSMATHDYIRELTSLPVDAQARARALAERLMSDGSQPLDVQTAAVCTAFHMRKHSGTLAVCHRGVRGAPDPWMEQFPPFSCSSTITGAATDSPCRLTER